MDDINKQTPGSSKQVFQFYEGRLNKKVQLRLENGHLIINRGKIETSHRLADCTFVQTSNSAAGDESESPVVSDVLAIKLPDGSILRLKYFSSIYNVMISMLIIVAGLAMLFLPHRLKLLAIIFLLSLLKRNKLIDRIGRRDKIESAHSEFKKSLAKNSITIQKLYDPNYAYLNVKSEFAGRVLLHLVFVSIAGLAINITLFLFITDKLNQTNHYVFWENLQASKVIIVDALTLALMAIMSWLISWPVWKYDLRYVDLSFYDNETESRKFFNIKDKIALKPRGAELKFVYVFYLLAMVTAYFGVMHYKTNEIKFISKINSDYDQAAKLDATYNERNFNIVNQLQASVMASDAETTKKLVCSDVITDPSLLARFRSIHHSKAGSVDTLLSDFKPGDQSHKIGGYLGYDSKGRYFSGVMYNTATPNNSLLFAVVRYTGDQSCIVYLNLDDGSAEVKANPSYYEVGSLNKSL